MHYFDSKSRLCLTVFAKFDRLSLIHYSPPYLCSIVAFTPFLFIPPRISHRYMHNTVVQISRNMLFKNPPILYRSLDCEINILFRSHNFLQDKQTRVNQKTQAAEKSDT